MGKMIERKIAGGKLVQVEVESKNGVISSVRITGDFFMHPEHGLNRIEGALAGLSINEVHARMPGIFAKVGVECIGFSPNDISSMIMEAAARREEGD